MQTQQQQQTQTITGEVEAVNERGVKVNGAWLNFSKFSEVPRPEVGQTVALTVRGDRWVQGLRVLGADGQVPLDDFDGTQAPPVDDDDPGTWGYRGEGRGTAAPRPVRQAAPAPAVKLAPAPAAPAGRRCGRPAPSPPPPSPPAGPR